MVGLAATDVIGREDELSAIEPFLADVGRAARARPLRRARDREDDPLGERGRRGPTRFAAVLTCHGVEAEATLSFAGLSELLVPVLEAAAPSLAPPRRQALEVALLLVEPGDQPLDAHAVGLAVLDVLHALAARGPVLVALDDVQWLDPSSAGVLQIALRRLREEPVGVLVTVREGPGLAVPFELDRSTLQERLEWLSVGPLSLGAIHTLLSERLGLELTRPELGRVQDATAGNPFFALELSRELVRTNTRPSAGRALRVPESLQELLGGRLARLPAETVDVLLQVAALARPTVELVDGGVRRSRACARGTRDGRAGRRRRARRLADPLLAPTAGLDLLRAGAGLEAPRRSPGARRACRTRSRSAHAIWRSPRKAPTRRCLRARLRCRTQAPPAAQPRQRPSSASLPPS